MASIQYLTEIAGGKAAILEQAAADPKIAKKRKPDQDQVVIAVVKVVERRSIAGAADLVRDDLQEALDTYLLVQGDRFMADDPDEWDSGLDDKVEAIFAPYNDVLSSDFLATATIDSGLAVEVGVEAVAQKFGKEVYKQLCWLAGDKDTPGKLKQPLQILTSAGILTSDILGHFGDRIATSEAPVVETPAEIAAEAATLDASINTMRKWLADNFVSAVDPDLLGNLVDSDDTLSQGAATQLGLSPADAVAFQMLAMDKGDAGAVEYIQQQLSFDYVDEPAAVPAPPSPPKPVASKGTGPRMNDVLHALKAHGGTALNDLATLVGVSRGTLNNYLNDKTDWTPDDDVKGRVMARIEEHMAGMMSARALLEGAN